jgi:hypothetical protein
MGQDKTPLAKGEHIMNQYEQMRPLFGLLGLFGGEVGSRTRELEEQFARIERMKEERAAFATRFGPRGWTIYDRLSVDVVRDAVNETEDDAADQLLVAHHLDLDTLMFLGYRFNVSRFEAWQEIYERAVERAAVEDFLSAVPLVLIIIDGICNTKTGKHPFSGGADAPVFDTETSGPGGLSAGLAILGATRRKLDRAPIESPYRHGILHGLDPNFGNALVAAKAFNLLQTMVDYFDRREDEGARLAKAAEEQRQPSWSEIVKTMASTRDTTRRIDEWKARPRVTEKDVAAFGQDHALEPDSPEAVAASFLNAVVARNFGKIAHYTIDYTLRPIGQRAGMHREELGQLTLTAWRITGVSDEAPAISDVDVALEGTLDGQQWTGTQKLRLIYGDEKFEVRVRGARDGRWAVMPNFLNKLWSTAVGSFKRSDC